MLPVNSNNNWSYGTDNDSASDHYTFVKSENKICSISIYIFKGEKNRRTEVHVHTWDKDTYFKIVECGQNHLLKGSSPTQNEYYFGSCYSHFPKAKNGLCDVRCVKYLDSLDADLFSQTHLVSGLSHHDAHKTNPECFSNIMRSLEVVKEADESVSEVITLFDKALRGKDFRDLQMYASLIGRGARKKDCNFRLLPKEILLMIMGLLLPTDSYLDKAEAIKITAPFLGKK